MELEVEIPQYSLCSRDFNIQRDMTLCDRTLGMLSPSAFFHIVIMPWIFLLWSGKLRKKKGTNKKPNNYQCIFISFTSFSNSSGKCLMLCNTTQNINMCTIPALLMVPLSTEAEDFWLTQHSIRKQQKQRKLSCRSAHTHRGKTGLWSLAPDQWDIHSLCWASKKISSRAMACTSWQSDF